MERRREGQLTLNLFPSAVEEALQRFGEGKSLNLDFAKKVNAVAGLYPDDMPLDRLLVYSQEQKKRIIAQARSYRKYDLGVYGQFLQEFKEEREVEGTHPHLEQRITDYEELLEKMRQPIDVELAPESWQTFMSELTLDQRIALVKTIGSIHDLAYRLRRSFIDDSPVKTIGDLREIDLGNINLTAKRIDSLSEIFRAVAFKKVDQQQE